MRRSRWRGCAAGEDDWLVLAEPLDCDGDGGLDGHFFSAGVLRMGNSKAALI
jgi:hypothetical protein